MVFFLIVRSDQEIIKPLCVLRAFAVQKLLAPADGTGAVQIYSININ